MENEAYYEAVARVAHEANRAYCATLGDNSQSSWDDAPQWQRDSAIAGAKFHFANPNADPSDSHVSWFKQKEADGWVYGEVKDAEKKTHPCMVPYHDLPAEQRRKDYLFKAICSAMFTRISCEKPGGTFDVKAVYYSGRGMYAIVSFPGRSPDLLYRRNGDWSISRPDDYDVAINDQSAVDALEAAYQRYQHEHRDE